jgi:ubiquinone/menaquinone biosynthesis C-methylase UbiE
MLREPEPEAMDIAEEADAYAAADFADVNNAFVNRLLYFVGVQRPSFCLDLGTGPGDIPIRIIRQGIPWRILAADVSHPMLTHAGRAVRKAGHRWAIHLVQTDAKSMPFSSGTFDVIFSNSILHHLSDMQPFWAEIKRVGKPGAFVLLRDLARPDTPDGARAIVDKYASRESALLQEEFYRSLLASYTLDELRVQLSRAQLNLLRVEMVSDRHLDVFGRLPGGV